MPLKVALDVPQLAVQEKPLEPSAAPDDVNVPSTPDVVTFFAAVNVCVVFSSATFDESALSATEFDGSETAPLETVRPFDAVRRPADVTVPVPLVEMFALVEMLFAVLIVPNPEAIEPDVRAPTPVSDEPVIELLSDVPVSVPAAAGMVMLPVPSKLTPLMVRALWSAVAVPALPVMLPTMVEAKCAIPLASMLKNVVLESLFVTANTSAVGPVAVVWRTLSPVTSV